MFVALMPILNLLIGSVIAPFVKAWSDYKLASIKTNEAGFAAGAAADVAQFQALANAEIANNQLKLQVYGHPINRFVMWVVGAPVAIHFSMMFVDTILAAHCFFGHPVLRIAAAPAPFDMYEWLIVESFFLIQGVHLGTSNVSQWLNSKKP